MKAGRHTQETIGRLRKRADFLRVQSAGHKWVTPLMIIQMAPMLPDTAATEGGICRFGLTITKKILPNATDRNRLRRRFRALILDFCIENAPEGCDFVVLPRLPALKSPRLALEKDLKWAIKRLTAPKNDEKTQN